MINMEDIFMNFSLIIPVYNGVQHIENIKKNIDDFKKNFPDNGEIIIINDGSTDNTHSILKNVEGVIYVETNNYGVSSARNTGLQLSNNEFLIFLDADDSIDFSSLFHVTKLISSNDNLIFSNFKIDNILVRNLNYKCVNVESILFLNDFLRKKNKIHLGSFIFRGSFLKNNSIVFDEDCSYGEDLKFIFDCLMESKSILYSNHTYFNYVLNISSNVSAMNSPINFKKIKFIDDLNEYIEKNKKFKIFQLYVCLSVLKYSLKYGFSDRKVQFELYKRIIQTLFSNIFFLRINLKNKD